ncbi:MAG: glycosyltransferase [Planctomycetaceae bacterium]
MTANSRNPLSVTMCITELDVGGAEKAFVRIALGLQNLGWDVRVVSLRDSGVLSDELAAAGISVTALGCGGFFDGRTFFRLRHELRINPSRILLCFLYQANVYGRLAARFGGGPVVISGIRVADRRKLVVWSDRWTRCWSAHYVAVSQQVAQTHAALCGIPADKICWIPNGVDIPLSSELLAAAERPPLRLLFVGRMTQQKDPLTLLQAFQRLPEPLRHRTTLDYVGEGPLAATLEAEIERSGLSSQVRLLRQRSDVPDLMRASTVLVLPSRWEGLPNVILEAMANQLPVIATDVDGIRELIRPAQSGWLVPAGNPSALAVAITQALESPELRRMFAEESQRVVAKGFTWPAVIAEYDRLLRRFALDQSASQVR